MDVLLLVVLVAIVYVYTFGFCLPKLEQFVGTSYTGYYGDESTYKTDVNFLSGYVGPYIRDVLQYNRAKYGSVVAPKGVYDSYLDIARAQLRAWVDSTEVEYIKKYKDLQAYKLHNGITYKDVDGQLQLRYIKDGADATFTV